MIIRATRTVEVKYTFNGSDLAEAREGLHLSQAELAALTGICQSHISTYECSGSVTVREQTAKALEKAGVHFG